MKSARNTFSKINGLVLAGLLATVGASAMAQTPPAPVAPGQPSVQPARPAPAGDRMARHDPAKMQAFIAKRQAELKAKLKVTPAQEGAWTTFTASMQPPARMDRPTAEQRTAQRAEFEKLTTPQRIDKMKDMRAQRTAQRNAEMDKRGDAAKTFYAQLSPEQQKTFDTESSRMMGRHGGPEGHGGPRGHGGPGGPGMKG